MSAVLKAVLAFAGAVLFAIIAHQITLSGDRSALSYGFALISPILIIAGILWASGPYRIYWLIAISLALITWGLLDWPSLSPPWLLLAQHAGINACLACLFGFSLRSGTQSLVTRMARVVHGGHLHPDMLRYTRQVTWAWTGFFIIMTIASLTLFLTGQEYLWSVLANLLNMPLVILMFAAEFAFRHKHLPHIQHLSVFESIGAFSRLKEGETKRDYEH